MLRKRKYKEMYAYKTVNPGLKFLILTQGYVFINSRERGRERESNTDVREKSPSVPPIHAPTRCRTCNSGTCPDQDSNFQPLGTQDNAPTEAPGQV